MAFAARISKLLVGVFDLALKGQQAKFSYRLRFFQISGSH
jgi:hypothetical protein